MDEVDKPISSLIEILPQKGTLEWIGIRTERKQPLTSVESVAVDETSGLVGDHYKAKSAKRQVTLIQQEHLEAVSSFLGKEVTPFLTRRNLMVKGINLFALRNKQFQIGEVILEGTGYCHPCSRMEENLGPGGYNAMRGHGGITAKVIKGGEIKVGDLVELIGG
ncbi:MOSC domain-containing protein [Marinoscillum pacificum]|uniref:MOSC domain-containing protein n=1 Tax=Marinoscillum pacificum TaxID=392723 RepID=UPI0021575A21|nr:MOSC domain-containing protein [Marinoscillum pacificum]